jgi:hypothetical protein
LQNSSGSVLGGGFLREQEISFEGLKVVFFARPHIKEMLRLYYELACFPYEDSVMSHPGQVLRQDLNVCSKAGMGLLPNYQWATSRSLIFWFKPEIFF